MPSKLTQIKELILAQNLQPINKKSHDQKTKIQPKTKPARS